MTIQQKVALDLNKARLDQNKEALGILQVILGEFQRIDKEVSDKQAIQKLKSLKKSAIEMIDKTNSLTAQTEFEYYESYLPQIIPIENIKDWIADNVDFSSLRNSMQAIGLVKKQFGADCIDGEAVKNLITELTK